MGKRYEQRVHTGNKWLLINNRFKGLDLVNSGPKELWTEVIILYQVRSDQLLSRVRLFVTP